MVETRHDPQDDTGRPACDASAVWRDPERSPDERADDLLARLTLAEKVGQLGSRWALNDMTADTAEPDAEGAPADAASGDARRLDPDEVLNVAPMQDVFAASGTIALADAAAHGLGHLTRVYGSVPITPAGGAAEVMKQQRVVIDRSRLGIPAIVHEECLTGFTAFGATVYPAAIAWGATFDPDLVERMAAAIGRDMAALGIHQGLSPGARRRARLPVGPRRGDHGRGPLPRVDARHGIRAGAAGRGRHRDAQALRRLLRVARGPQPRPGADGPARADRRHPAALRDGGPRWAASGR